MENESIVKCLKKIDDSLSVIGICAVFIAMTQFSSCLFNSSKSDSDRTQEVHITNPESIGVNHYGTPVTVHVDNMYECHP